MLTAGRTAAAVLGVLALTVGGCSSSVDRFRDVGQSPSATVQSAVIEVPVAVTPVIARVIAAPVPVPATDGKVHLA